MSIIDGAVVYRVAGNRDMGEQMANNLIAQDNMRLRKMVLDTTNMLNVYRCIRVSDDERKLAEIRRRVNDPGNLWYRTCKWCAMWILLIGLFFDLVRDSKKNAVGNQPTARKGGLQPTDYIISHKTEACNGQ